MTRVVVCFTQDGRKYSLIDVARPATGSFALLESLNYEKSTARIVHVVTPNQTKSSFKLGRGHESDIRVTDISVSRFHAFLTCTKEGFFIEDNKSKFGTLALAPVIELSPSLSRAVQIGRTTVSFEVRPYQVDTYNSQM